jgi:lipoprotein-anchoring transpeptidase ErfK/SrfK
METMHMSRVTSRTPLILLAGLLGLLVLLTLGTYTYDHTQREHIAKGIHIDGIDVGNLSASSARSRLIRDISVAMERPVSVSLHNKTWRISPRQAGVVVDINATISEALQASRTGSIFSRTFRNLFGGRVEKNIPLHVTYSHTAVFAFASDLSTAINKAPQNATVEPSASGLTELPDRAGLAVERKRLAARVAHALTGRSTKRTLTVPTLIREPTITTNELAAQYPAYIIVNRAHFKLYFYQHLKLTSTYPIAVGMQGLETTPGLYHIQWKQINPPWYVPNSPWAGALAGKTIPPGPEDPLKARFMSFNGGAGIHGIAPSEYSSIGHDASHGCVRMRIPDVIALYARTPVGTPVFII